MKQLHVFIAEKAIESKLWSESIRRSGHVVAISETGFAAVEDYIRFLASTPFKRVDLVIISQEIPGLDGLSVIRRLHSENGHNLQPCVWLTYEKANPVLASDDSKLEIERIIPKAEVLSNLKNFGIVDT